MVVREPVDHLLQGHEPGGREHARLPHPAAQHLPVAMGLIDEVPGAADDRADRGRQALAQAEGDRVSPATRSFASTPSSARMR